MTIVAISPAKVMHIREADLFHQLGEISAWGGLQDQVQVVVHEAIVIEVEEVLLFVEFEQVDVGFEVFFILEDLLPVITSGHDMENTLFG